MIGVGSRVWRAVAAAVAACGARDRLAADAAAQSIETAAANDEHFLLFAGADALAQRRLRPWRPDVVAGGVDKEGFAAKLMARRRHLSLSAMARRRLTGYVTVFDVMPGWRFKPGNADITVFAGLDVQHHRLSPDDLNNAARGTHAGLRVGADFWWEPTTDDDDQRRRFLCHHRRRLLVAPSLRLARVRPPLCRAGSLGARRRYLSSMARRDARHGVQDRRVRMVARHGIRRAIPIIASGLYGRIGVLTRR